MNIKKIICLGCPLACNINVEINKDEIMRVRGAKCKVGKKYAIQECKEPRRVLTTTIRTTEADRPLLPVRTGDSIPKESIAECMKIMSKKIISPTIKAGDIVIENISGTGVNVIATGNLFGSEK
ncbi:MAG: DUF1667 domain-containing protein [Actinomycetota bacterium]|jgi:CxxC motif-containing protein|nr:DUF1667 domain-containing protein [Actinomycetota bacterium]